jgi:GT2 family glycosyltransferase
MIAVVLLTHGRVHLLQRCVENVLAKASELTTEIVIWDNGSRDGTADYLRSLEDPRLQVVIHPENIGQNAYAQAFALTTADYLVELDDDLIGAPEGWDRTLLEAFERLPDIGYLAADVVDDEHDTVAHHRYRVRPHAYTERVVDGIRLLEGPTGGYCAMTSRALYDAVGGFRQNPRHVFWEEETAYLDDIRELGQRPAMLADLKVHHAGGPHYSEQAQAKADYWTYYMRRQERKDRVKRVLLKIPFVAPLNERHRWFRLSDHAES